MSDNSFFINIPFYSIMIQYDYLVLVVYIEMVICPAIFDDVHNCSQYLGKLVRIMQS